MICTGNQCRSPMAESLLRHRLAERGVAARVGSAGTMAGGVPADPSALDALDRWGAPLDGHRSRQLTPQLVAGSDLVLGMAREHVRAAAVAAPEAFGRTFALRELVRRGAAAGPRRADEDLPAWLARVGEGRRPADVLGASTDDDVADPIGQPRAAFERTAAELAGLLDELVALAWGAGAAPAGPGGPTPATDLSPPR